MGQSALGGVEGAADVAGEDVVPHLQCQLVHPAILQTHIGRIVHQDVQLAVLLHRVGEELVNALGHGDVHEVVGCLAACGCDAVHHGLALGFPTAADDDLCALSGKQSGDADADPAGGACDNGYFSVQSVHFFLLLIKIKCESESLGHIISLFLKNVKT